MIRRWYVVPALAAFGGWFGCGHSNDTLSSDGDAVADVSGTDGDSSDDSGSDTDLVTPSDATSDAAVDASVDADAGTDTRDGVDPDVEGDGGVDVEVDAEPDAVFDGGGDGGDDVSDGSVSDCSLCAPEADCEADGVEGVRCTCPPGTVGDGTFCLAAAQILSFGATTNAVAPDATLQFEVITDGVVSCELVLDGRGVVGAFDSEQLELFNDIELMTVNVDASWWQTYRVLTGSTYVQFRLQCTGEEGPDGTPNTAEARAIVLLEQRTPLPMSLRGPVDGVGNAWEVCWTQVELPVCRLEVNGSSGMVMTETGLPGTGCRTIDLTENSQVMVVCEDGSGDEWSNAEYVRVGPGIVQADALPLVVPSGGGDARLDWESEGVAACDVQQDGVRLSTAPSGTLTIEVPAVGSTSVTVTCGPDSRTFLFTTPGIQEISVVPGSGRSLDVSHSSILGSNCTFAGTLGEEAVASLAVLSDVERFNVPLGTDPFAPLELVLTCESPDGPFSRSASFVADRPVIDSLNVDRVHLPAGGGDIEVCWATRATTSCSLRGFFAPITGLATTGCATLTIRSLNPVTLLCDGAFGSTTLATQVVSVGPFIQSFEITPEELADSGVVELTWASVETTSCSIQAGTAPAMMVATSGSMDLTVTESATVLLTCQNDTGSRVSRNRDVWVGYPIRNFEALYEDNGLLNVTWRAAPSLVCVLELTDESGASVFRADSGENPAGEMSVRIPAGVLGDSAGLVSLRCDSPLGPRSEERAIRALRMPTVTLSPEMVGPGDIQTICLEGSTFDSCSVRASDRTLISDVSDDICIDIERTGDLELVVDCSVNTVEDGRADVTGTPIFLPLVEDL